MQLRKRVKLADEPAETSAVQQQIETTDQLKNYDEEGNDQDIQIEIEEVEGMEDIVQVGDDVFED